MEYDQGVVLLGEPVECSSILNTTSRVWGKREEVGNAPVYI